MSGPRGRSTSRRARWTTLPTFLALVIGVPGSLRAQGVEPSRWAVTVGPEWHGPVSVGQVNATETGNETAPVTVFRTTTHLDAGVGISAGFGVRATSTVWAETAVRYRSTQLLTDVTGDIEGAADTTASESVQQLQVDAGGQWLVHRWQRGRLTPYLSGGAGYARQLLGDGTLVTSGASGYAGGGFLIELPARQGGAFRSLALRLDARAVWLGGGVTLDGAAHAGPALGVAIVFRR
jgi:hypothetical protein